MSAYVLSPAALQDLQDIWDFISMDSASAADKLEDEFFGAFERLARRPRMDIAEPISPSGMCFSGSLDRT
jgi:plasmid stabilization system protein ParE